MVLFARGLGARAPRFAGVSALAGVLLGLLLALPPRTAHAQAPPMPVMCGGGNQLPVQDLLMRPDGLQPDLIVNGTCNVDKGQNGLKPTVFYYGNVYILSGGNLHFEQPTDITQNPDIDFWASSIIVEANGTLEAGTTAAYGDPTARRDQWGGFLTIYLYGANKSVNADGVAQDPALMPGQGVLCMANPAAGAGPCGIPADVWSDNGKTLFSGCPAEVTPDSKCIPGLPTAAQDYFYQYGPLYGDELCSDGKTKWTPATGCGSGPPAPEVGYFGYKVLAVSYGGTLSLNGYKGAPSCPPLPSLCPILLRTSSGNSWTRLNGDLTPGAPVLTVEGTPGNRWWLATDAQNGHADEIVVTTTDYLPDHSEKLTLAPANGAQGGKITLAPTPAVKWFHRGTRYPIALGAAHDRLIKTGMDSNLVGSGAETRAAVALLTRNIRIVSAGDKAGETFAQAAARTACPDKTMGCYYFGGHTIFRQGIKRVQVQGVEFVQLGQGGKIGHYPIHFHKTRQVPPGTYVEDSAVNESNTRWYVLHSTQGVTFQRDVGWESIGHGYYLEDGTEADNNFYSDIGIFARAAIANPDNPRMIPGILADNQDPASFIKANPANVANPGFVYRSDNEYPAVFWISNGWNNFQGDMAAGAGACGAAYWFVPMANTDTPDVPTADNVYTEPDGGPKTTHMKWADGGVEPDGTVHFGYAGLQRLPLWAASTPLESFYMNYATSTMMSFQTTGDAPACEGFAASDAAKSNPPTVPYIPEIASFAPKPTRAPLPPPNPNKGEGPDLVNDPFYPHAIGLRQATRCAVSKFQVAGLPTRYDCTPPKPGFAGLRTPCTDSTDFLVHNPGMLDDPNNPEVSCGPIVIDHFTSSFHWAQGDVSAMWLRPQWYLVTNSVLSDVQQGGITFVTGGDVFRSSIITGYWGLLRNSILVGHTQPQNDATHRFASDIGPFNSFTAPPYKCEKATGSDLPSYCLNKAAGISLPLTGFFNNQRLENIYDGPSYRDSTAYLDVTTAGCPVGDFNTAVDTCIYGTKQTSGVLKNPGGMPGCYVPNAAIAWKQPNGFFYPPAFHANNLYFGNVNIRHFVIDPLFKAFDGSTSPFVDPNSQDFGQAGTYIGDGDAVSGVYCLPPNLNTKLYFNGFTSIDRQTELNDDDGSLTGLSNDIQPTLMPPNPLKQTISVNEDDFFTAPVETSECASNIGNNVMPDNACMSPVRAAPTVTAKTSPYDYVSTVIYHLPNTGLNPADRWDADCTNPTCYGVPLYRQFLAGDPGDPANGTQPTREWKHWLANGCNTDPTKFGITKACRWPFIRMAGTAKSTRETLTVNNGTYYLDTTVPLNMQLSEVYNTSGSGGATQNINANPFLANETYDVFFVYAKPTTVQTYLVYLGNNATAANVKPIQFRLDTMQVTTLAGQPWLTADDKQTATTGIVAVTVDFRNLKDDSLETLPKNGLCQPRTFCTGTGTTCVSALKDTDPLVIANPGIKQQADAVCGQWAVKDLDCPPAGCYGFSFTIPTTGFVAGATIDNPSPNRPAPVAFPKDDLNQGKPTWLVRFLQTTEPPDNTAGGECHYTTLPTYPPPRMGECTVPDWVPQ